MNRICIAILLAFSLVTALPVFATDQMTKIETRPGVTVPFYYMNREGAKASIILLTGGGGGIGLKDGIPTSNNFLIRSRDLFAGNGFNVAVVGKPSDVKGDLDGVFRISPEHVADLRHIMAFLKKDTGLPVWLVGTSMGTISATAVATVDGNDDLAGIVLTSSVTSHKKSGAVLGQKLDKIHVPVLVLHHEKDECRICLPSEAAQIIRGLTHAPIKKEIFVKGGADPRGDPCQALHWHGFIGMEKEAVDIITSWIIQPVN